MALLAAGFALRADDADLTIGDIIEGELGADEERRYNFTALALTLLSIRVEALDESLDPQFALLDSAGRLVTANDDFAYPETTDAAAQAFILPKTGMYTLVVTGYRDSFGRYRLHALPGYDSLALRDALMNRMDWQVAHSDAEVGMGASTLFALDMTGQGASAAIIGDHFPHRRDFYFEADFDYVSAVNNWQVGLVFRYRSPQDYQRLLLSKAGYWRLETMTAGGFQILRDWTTHPAIEPGDDAFRLGVLAAGQHIDVVYKGQVVGTVWDERAPEAGGAGIAMRTDETYGGLMSFAVLETLMTVPTRIEEGAPIIPKRLLARRSYLMAQDLARHQLAPGDGELKVTVSDSSARANRSGATLVPIASELAFERFALGVTVDMDLRSDGNGGCGIAFHVGNDEFYTLAYVTSAGEFGLSRREGAGFQPGVYGKREPDSATIRQLLLVVSDEVAHLYVDEEYAGSLPSQPRMGSLGIGVVNYEVVDTTCDFSDLWLFSYD